ncbi:MAG: serine hydrolase domain-containing protein [Trueperaceae bacterium]
MTLDRRALTDAIRLQHEREPFSGVVSVRERGEVVFEQAFGLAHRAERIPNTPATRFGIASGTKTLTAIAVAQLVEQGRLAFDARLADCVDAPLPAFDPDVTLHHLLTHSAGIPDYFDEAVMDDYEALWRERPMYRFRTPSDFLPLFAHLPMKAAPGTTWAYNNAGYVLLGLAVERAAGMPFTAYVERHVMRACGMSSSGFFPLDRLPGGTARGYIPTGDGGWRTNAYAVPIVGGADGGAFTTAHDLAALWDALLGGRLVGEATLARLLTPHWRTDPERDDGHYGYGIWIRQRGGQPAAYTMMGEDPGVAFSSTYDPGSGVLCSLLGNTVDASWAMLGAIAPILEAA